MGLKKIYLFFIIAILILGYPFLSFAQKIDKPKVIRISLPSRSMNFLSEIIAQKKGMFFEEGLKVELVQIKANLTVAALSSGDVSYTSAFGSTIRAGAKGMEMKVVMATQSRPPQILVARPEYPTMESLKGKIVGVSSMGGSEFFYTKDAIEHFKLDPFKDIKIIIVGDSLAKLQAMEVGRIQAGLLSAPAYVMAMKKGYKFIMRIADINDVPNAGLGVMAKKIKEDPDEVKRVIKAIIKALEFIQRDKNGTVEIIMDWLKMEKDVAEISYDLTLNTYSRDGSITEKDIRNVLNLAKIEDPTLKADIPVSQVADFSILKEALREYKGR